MRKLKYPIGISDFAEMRNNGYYYIDKTNLIVDLLSKVRPSVSLKEKKTTGH